jgi:hypothetical protein
LEELLSTNIIENRKAINPLEFYWFEASVEGHCILGTRDGLETTPLTPVNRGTGYIYGTYETDLSHVNLMDALLKWTTDGQGGNGKGKL